VPTPTALQHALDLHDEFIQCEAEMLEEIAGRRRFTEAIEVRRLSFKVAKWGGTKRERGLAPDQQFRTQLPAQFHDDICG